MSDPTNPASEPPSTSYRSFVLRVRQDRSGEKARSIVDLEDVQTTQTARFLSLERAFAHIRQLLGFDRGDHPPP